jgi:hypothetical protein
MAGEERVFFAMQSRGHSAHIGQDVTIHYRWHPLCGRSARRIQIERRATGEFVHVELTPGDVTIMPAWKIDPVYCAGLKVGAPQVSLAALCALHELLVACESRQLSSGGNIATQETQDGIAATAHTKDRTCSETGATTSDIPTPARPRSRRRAASGHDAGGAPGGTQVAGSSTARGERHHDAGGRR